MMRGLLCSPPAALLVVCFFLPSGSDGFRVKLREKKGKAHADMNTTVSVDKPTFGLKQATLLKNANTVLLSETPNGGLPCGYYFFKDIQQLRLFEGVPTVKGLGRYLEVKNVMPHWGQLENPQSRKTAVVAKESAKLQELGVPAGAPLGLIDTLGSFQSLEAVSNAWVKDQPGKYKVIKRTRLSSEISIHAKDAKKDIWLDEGEEVEVLAIESAPKEMRLRGWMETREKSGWFSLLCLDDFFRFAERMNPGRDDLQSMLRFEMGKDFRKCWGDLEDFGKPDRGVCGNENIQMLQDEITKPEFVQNLKADKAGQSGSTIVFAANFAVKSADEKEFKLMGQVLPSFSYWISFKQATVGNCFSTGLAPICAAFFERMNENGQPIYWLLTRAIKLNGRESLKVRGAADVWNAREDEHGEVKGGPVGWFDLKSPVFSRHLNKHADFLNHLDPWASSNLGDGKTMLSREKAAGEPVANIVNIFKAQDPYMWRNKDIGFHEAFPKGMQLMSCGSREAVIAFFADTNMLAAHQMTDYSAFLQLYKRQGNDSSCACEAGAKPTFPIVLQVDPPSQPDGALGNPTEPVTIAMGVIDYIERKTNPQYLSTMRNPVFYSYLWKQMFSPIISSLPRERTYFKPSNDKIFKVGDRVMILAALDCSLATKSWNKQKFPGQTMLGGCDYGRIADESHYSRLRVYPQNPANPKSHECSPKLSTKACGVLPGDFGTVVHMMEIERVDSPLIRVAFDLWSGEALKLLHAIDDSGVLLTVA